MSDNKNEVESWVSDSVDASYPRLSTHFLTKFENQNQNTLLSPIFDHHTVTTKSNSTKCLFVSKKHSGSLLMAPPFYSKNSTANRFSRMGAIVMRDYMCAVWDDPIERPKMFTAWWVDAERRGLCYSFELVVPRMLGDHGATPEAAYLVLTTVALTSDKSSRFLSPAEVIELATRWRLPLNEVWYCPADSAIAVEKALHNARWTLKDSEVDQVLSSINTDDETPSIVRQSFLTHLETQGEVLEGFVLMALEVENFHKLTQFVNAYNKEMAPCHDRVLRACLALGKRCRQNDPILEKTINTIENGGIEILLNANTTGPAPEPQIISIDSSYLWESVCRSPGDVGGMFRRLRDSYQHKVGFKAYRYRPIGDSVEVVMSNRAAGMLVVPTETTINKEEEEVIPYFDGKCRQCQQRGHKASDCAKIQKKSKLTSTIMKDSSNGHDVLQVQIDVHDDNVFYSWPLHVRAGGCAPLYRGLVVQFDPSSSSSDSDSGKKKKTLDIAKSIGIETKIEMKILGIEKLKCLNYIWRTFGVRNQLPCLLNQGSTAYLRRCKTGFFKNWSVPSEYHDNMLCLFEGWAQYVQQFSDKMKEKAFNKQTYLDILEDYLNSNHPLALRASHIVSGIVATDDKTNPSKNKRKKLEPNQAAQEPNIDGGQLAGFYVVVSNLTGKSLNSKMLNDLGLTSSNMLLQKPDAFLPNTWFSTDKIPIPWMFDGGSKASRKSRNKGKGRTAPIPQLAIVFGPPPISPEATTDNPLLAGEEEGMWKHLLDQGPRGWVAKNPNIPLYINPQDTSFLDSLTQFQLKQQQSGKEEEEEEMKNLPLVIVVGILALPPGGGKSTFMKLLQEKANAVIVSSDECTIKNIKFDKEIVRIVNNATNSSSSSSKKNKQKINPFFMHSSTGKKIYVIGYDKNIPDEKGFEKMLKILRPCSQPNKYELKISIIVPREIDQDECWNRILKRDDRYLLTPATKDEKDVHKIFNHFYAMTSSFILKAQGLVSNQSCITECFFNDPTTSSNDEGLLKCTALVDTLISAKDPLYAQNIDQLEEALFTADASTGGGGGGGGGGNSGKVNWCAANVLGTSLHLTLVPPPGSRSAEEDKDRFSIIKKLKAKTGQKLTLSASRYHIAEIKDTNSKHDARKRVGFWEVDSIAGLEEDEHYPSQRRCYHITDVGSLGNSTKPFASFEVLDASGGRGTLGLSSNTVSLPSKKGKKSGALIAKRGLDLTNEQGKEEEEEDTSSIFMKRCMELAAMAKSKGNDESGGVVVYQNKIVVEAEHNVFSFGGDVTATTECLMIRKLCQSKLMKTQQERSHCIAYFNSEPDSLGIELLKRGGIQHVIYGVHDLKTKKNSWTNSKIKTEKFLLSSLDNEVHESKKSRVDAAAQDIVPSSYSSLAKTPNVSQVGAWTVKTFALNPPLQVEAIVSMR